MKKILLFILTLTVIILWLDFFVKSGTYFLLDGPFFPIESLRYSFWESSIFWFLNDSFVIVLWYILYSKIFFFSILFASWFLGYLLAQEVAKLTDIDKKYWSIAGIFGIIFMMINPFLYERMITQPGVYLAIVWLGYGFYFLLKNLTVNKTKNYLLSGLFFGLSIGLSPHTVFMIGVILLVYALIFSRDKKGFLNLIYLSSITVLLNLNWLIGGFLFWKSNVINSVSTFWQANIDNFLSNGIHPLWVELTNVLLYGFWGERYGHFILPNIMNDKWYIAGILILFVLLFWIYRTYVQNKKITLFLVIIWIISLVLGVWTASHTWWYIIQFLYDHIPYYIGLREPQKWIWVLMLIYCVFFVVWMTHVFLYFDRFFGILHSKMKTVWVVFIIFLFLNAWSPNVIFGFNKQLFMTDYPKEFFQFKKEKIVSGENYLVLPWHSYFACDWTRGRIIANVMGEFFKPWNSIISDNIEIGTLYTNVSSQRSKDIEEFLKTNDLNLLKKYHISDIVFLDKCADYKKYDFLEKNSSFQKEFESPYLKSYKIN